MEVKVVVIIKHINMPQKGVTCHGVAIGRVPGLPPGGGRAWLWRGGADRGAQGLVLGAAAAHLHTRGNHWILELHNVAKRPFGISISERLYLFSRTPSGAPNGSPALTYKWTTQLLKEIAPPWPLDLSEGHGGGPGVVGDEQHWEVQQITHGTSWPSPVNHLNCWRPLVIHIYTLSTHFISKTINGIISTPFGLWFHSFDLIPVIRGTVDKYTIWSRTMAYLNHI